MSTMQLSPAFKFTEEGLCVGSNDASVAGLVEEHGTPLYIYSGERIVQNIESMRAALRKLNEQTPTTPRKGKAPVMYYAMKANRYKPILELIRAQNDVGVDACSPNEVQYALDCGFSASEISYTSSFLSNKDLKRLVQLGVHVNLDSFSALRRYAEVAPQNTKIGIRINLGNFAADGYSEKTNFTDKFGMPVSDFPMALRTAHELGFVVDTVHFHVAWNYPSHSLESFAKMLSAVLSCATLVGPSLAFINVGGGLGVKHHASHDDSLSSADWASALRSQLLVPLRAANKNVRIVCEMGTRLLADAGILVTEVTTVEPRASKTWVGVDCGYNVNNYSAGYGIKLTVTPVKNTHATPKEERQKYQISGHLNESVDVFAVDEELPPLEEGDLLAFYPCGAYGSAMASNHSMRGQDLKEVLVDAP